MSDHGILYVYNNKKKSIYSRTMLLFVRWQKCKIPMLRDPQGKKGATDCGHLKMKGHRE